MRLFKPRPTLTQLPAIPLVPEAVLTLHSAAEFRAELLRRIAAAGHRIYLCSLYLQNDEAGAEVLHALHAAKTARPALEIAVLVDWHRAQRGLIGASEHSGNAGWYRELAAARDSVVPIYGVPVQTRELFGVLHLKGFVIDDTVIYSGASLNNVYLHKQEKYRHDRYLLLRNSVLADCMVEFTRRHILAAPAVHRLDQAGPPATRSIRGDIRRFREQLKRARYSFSLPHDHAAAGGLCVTPLVGVGKSNPLNRAICSLLAASRQQITICTPYFNLPPAVTRELNRALQRGVQIDIIVGDKTANDFFIPPEQDFKIIGALPYLYEVNLRRFARKHQAAIASGQLNLHLWKEGENSYHLKGLWIDSHYSLMTGNNLNPRAFRLDLENALLIHDPQQQLASQRRTELAGILRDTTVLTGYQSLQQLADYPPPVRKLLSRLSRTRLDLLAYRVL
ncbi:MAG: CDP-diacylglycerol--serine O-phosphatidyltransferase [Burkholderiales bacterium]|nr:CDP-diacylglycerol--serine O-phosphatidyltransferase [Burkholderiales bacterium]